MIYLDEDLASGALRQALRWYWGAIETVTAVVPHGLDDTDIVDRLAGEKGCIFVTNNTSDFWNRLDAHPRFCILCIDAPKEDAELVSRLIRATLAREPFASRRSRQGWMGVITWYGRSPRDRHVGGGCEATVAHGGRACYRTGESHPCKNLVGARLKGAGMRWNADTARPMVHLRAALLTHPDLDLRAYAGRSPGTPAN